MARQESVDIRAVMMDALNAMRPMIRDAIKKKARQTLLNTPHLDYVTFRDELGRIYRPEVTSEYVRALWCYTFKKRMDGSLLSCSVNQKIADAVEVAISEVLTSPDFANQFGEKLRLPEMITTGVIDKTLNETADRLIREIKRAVHLPGGATMETRLADLTAAQLAAFFQTAAGQTVLTAIGHAAASAVGKVAIMNAAKLAFVKFKLAAVLSTLSHYIVAKIGVVAAVQLTSTVVLAGAAPWLKKLRVNQAQVQAIINVAALAALAAMLAYTVVRFPEKMADEAPPKIAEEVDRNWPDISSNLVDSILFEITKMTPQELARHA